MEAVIGVLIFVIALFAVITLVRSVRIVPQQRMDVVERLGKYKRTLSPGLNLLVPFVDAVRTKVDMREQVVSSCTSRSSTRSGPRTRSRTSCRPSSSSPSPRCET
jgi:regulator of protease activity HflC (stomatin/prohibitin superfamily)